MSIIRPHKKSRDGCEGCKRRKIKCDEVHPSCTFCSSRRVQCIYPVRAAKAIRTSPGSSPGSSSNSSTSPNSNRQLATPSPIGTQFSPNLGLKMGELRLMHNYSVNLAPQLGLAGMDVSETMVVWQREIPQMAFEHDFLMHIMLSISSHHLQTNIEGAKGDVASQARQTDYHLDTALSGYRNAVANLNAKNIEAVLAASLIMVVMATRHYVMHVEGELWIVSFLGLHAGMQSLESVLGKDKLSQCSLYPLLCFDHKLAGDPSVPPFILQEMLGSQDSSNLTGEQMRTLYDAVHCLGKLYVLLGAANSRHAQGQFFIKLMASGKVLPPYFVTMIRQRVPQALVVVAHYLCFQIIPTMHDGFLEKNIHSDLSNILYGLEPKWRRYVEIPWRILPLRDSKDVTMHLLSQLPPGHLSSAPLVRSPGEYMMSGRVEEITTPEAHNVGTSPGMGMPSGMGMSPSMGMSPGSMGISSGGMGMSPGTGLPAGTPGLDMLSGNSGYFPEQTQPRPGDHSPGGVLGQSSGNSPTIPF